MKKFRKVKISKHSKYLKNPSLNHLNYNSHFIYDLDKVREFLIEEIDLNKKNKEDTIFISINKENFNIIKNYVEVKEMNNPLTTFIKRQLEDKEKRYLLSFKNNQSFL